MTKQSATVKYENNRAFFSYGNVLVAFLASAYASWNLAIPHNTCFIGPGYKQTITNYPAVLGIVFCWGFLLVASRNYVHFRPRWSAGLLIALSLGLYAGLAWGVFANDLCFTG